MHGCKHEGLAISADEHVMKEKHKNFKIVKCGMFINKEYPWLHATPDFLCSCDCCGEGCGEVKCLFCIHNCDFESYVSKSLSCLRKDSAGNFWLKKEHEYFYQTQQQLFTVERKYCDLLCVLLMGVVPPNFFTSEFCLRSNTGILFCPSSLNFGEHAFCLKCLVNGTLGGTLWLMSKLINNQNQVAFAIAERTLLKKVSFVVIPNAPLFLFIYHVSRLKAFQKLTVLPPLQKLTGQSSRNQGKPK